MALERTVAVSPRIAPYPMHMTDAASSVPCMIGMIAFFISHAPFVFFCTRISIQRLCECHVNVSGKVCDTFLRKPGSVPPAGSQYGYTAFYYIMLFAKSKSEFKIFLKRSIDKKREIKIGQML